MAKPILIALDLSPASRTAFDAGLALAADFKAPIASVHAYDAPVQVPFMVGPEGRAAIDIGNNAGAEAAAVELTTKWAELARATISNVHAVCDKGRPAEVILAAATEFDAAVIVAGTHGHQGLKRVLLGSVATKLVQRSKIPVLVIPIADET